MPLISWKNEYSVRINEIDKEHKRLIDLMNKLHDAMLAGKAKDILEKILGELVAYTKFHFSSEEALMQTNGYPGLSQHRKQHSDLTEKVYQYQKEYRSGKMTISIELMDFLKNWLVSHIQGTDKLYSPFLNAKGIS